MITHVVMEHPPHYHRRDHAYSFMLVFQDSSVVVDEHLSRRVCMQGNFRIPRLLAGMTGRFFKSAPGGNRGLLGI